MAKILLADDSTHAQRMGTKILSAEGHEVSTVSNGQAAIQTLEHGPPELVIADVFMPGRNGYEVCHFIKTDDKLKNIPVLLIIGAMEPYDPEEGRRAGADGLITKPLESSSLLSTVNDLLSAAKRFAPARAEVDKAEEPNIAVEKSKEGVEEAPPQWDDAEEEIITAPPDRKLEIPDDLSQQPVGMLTDVMQENAASETPAFDMEDGQAPVMEQPMEAFPDAPEQAAMDASLLPGEPPSDVITQAAEMLADPGSAPQLDRAGSSTWTAEPAEMTPEEARLFDQPTSNWGDLEQMVEQGSGNQPEAASLPWQMAEAAAEVPMESVIERHIESPAEMEDAGYDPELETREEADVPVEADALLIRPEETPSEVAEAPGIEHYEDLSEATVAHPELPPLPPAPVTEALAPEEAAEEEATGAEFSGPVEELEASPEERNLPPIEQLVRQAIDDLMPEIIDRVKQSLKS